MAATPRGLGEALSVQAQQEHNPPHLESWPSAVLSRTGHPHLLPPPGKCWQMRGLGVVGALDGPWEVVGLGPHLHCGPGPLVLTKDPGWGSGRWLSLAVVAVENLEEAEYPQSPHLKNSPLPPEGAGGVQAVEQAL